MKISKRVAPIKVKVSRWIGKSDRAIEGALRYAEPSRKRQPGIRAEELAIIQVWLCGLDRHGDSNDFDSRPIANDAARCND